MSQTKAELIKGLNINASAPATALNIDSSGRVGIGTSSPGAGLHIATAGQTTSALDTSGSLNLLVSDTGASVGNGGSIVFGFNSGSGRFASIKGQVITSSGNSTGHLTFSTRNATSDATLTERLRITNDGRVGIGSSSPSQTLEVSSSVANAAKIRLSRGGATTNYLQFEFDGGSSAITSNGITGINGDIVFKRDSNTGTSTESARIDSSGRLLVGTSSAPSNGELLRVTKASSGTEGAAINLFGEYSLADDASQTITLPHAALIMVTDQTTGRAGLLFATYDSATITTVSDPSNIIATSDTDTKLCVFKSAGTNNITVKNRLGAARNIGVGKITIL